jgi:hypothetical protein
LLLLLVHCLQGRRVQEHCSRSVSDSQHRWQVVVPDNSAVGTVLHVDPNPGEAEQPGNDRMTGLVLGDLAAEFAGVTRAQSNSVLERFKATPIWHCLEPSNRLACATKNGTLPSS